MKRADNKSRQYCNTFKSLTKLQSKYFQSIGPELVGKRESPALIRVSTYQETLIHH